MDYQKRHKKVTAIVPAYNEATRIGAVLAVLTQCECLDEIIVIDDGSTDNTKEIVEQFQNIQYIQNQKNLGKGKSLDIAIEAASGDIFFFCDADVKGLRRSVVNAIVAPVQSGKVEMFIGMRNRKIFVLRFIFVFLALLGGERAMTRSLWEILPEFYKKRFRVEAGLNFFAAHYKRGFRFKVFHGLTQTIKEKKYGFLRGFKSRMGMTFDSVVAFLVLRFYEYPKFVWRYLHHKKLF
jgi:glycosyltransferase involved in cell wall biosynthesis